MQIPPLIGRIFACYPAPVAEPMVMRSIFVLLLSASLLGLCVNDYPSRSALVLFPSTGPQLFGVVAGLENPGLVLQTGTHQVTLSSSGPFSFSDGFEPGESYDVFIATAPAGYVCTISNGSGIITGSQPQVGVDCLKVADLYPANQMVILDSTALQLRFTRSMAGCTIDTGTGMGAESPTITWTSTNSPMDTLTITPAATWTHGANRILVASCDDVDGKVTLSLSLLYFVAADQRYVSATGTDSSGTNTCSSPTTPCATIAHAISMAPACGGSEDCMILVAEGDYDQGVARLDMVDGISVLGGFSPDFASRDPWARNSRIFGSGSACGALNCLIRFPAASDDTTVLDGFTVNGPSAGAVTVGIQFAGGGTVRNSTVDGGQGTTNRSAVLISSPPVRLVQLTHNYLTNQTTAHQQSLGVEMNSGQLFAYSNVMATPTATQRSMGIQVNGGQGIIDSNFIFSGPAGAAESAGIQATASGTWVVANNYVHSGAAPGLHSVALDIQAAISGPIINNLLQGDATSPLSYCIREVAGLPGAVALQSNNLWDCNSALLRDSTNNYTSICTGGFGTNSGCGTLYSGATTAANLSVTPQFDPLHQFYFGLANPCTVSQGGVDPTTVGHSIYPDAGGATRPGADGFYSIGPLEPLYACIP